MKNARPFHRGQLAELSISDIAFGGKGIAKVATEKGDYIVFIPDTIKGQKVLCRMVKVKGKYAEAKLQKVLEFSPLEIKSEYFPIPGSPYISLPLDAQAAFKKSTSIELFKRIGKIENAAKLFDEYINSPRSFHYRNKMEYSFSAVSYDKVKEAFIDEFALGFKKRGQWLGVEPLLRDSGMFDAQLENFIPAIAEYFTSRGLKAWHSRTHEGFCRMLAVKKSFYKNQLLINLMTSSSQLEVFDAKDFGAFLHTEFGERLAGFVHTVNDDVSDRPKATEGKQHIIYGENTIVEKICGLKFTISLESFFQTNPSSAEKLYQKALDYVFEVEQDQKPIILDLFSGTGTITQLLAMRAEKAKVIGVEIIQEAVNDALANAKINGIKNLDFFADDVGNYLLTHPQNKGKINTLTLDPPRAGIMPKTLQKIIKLEAERIVYISCNPATQARDMEALAANNYKLKKFSLVDQFPHTAHIECVALFEKL